MEWSSLAWQPTFTATSSNVLFYWSHDIGGHRSQVCPGPNTVGPCYKSSGHDEAAYDPELCKYTQAIILGSIKRWNFLDQSSAGMAFFKVCL